jgi:hypothetical protein
MPFKGPGGGGGLGGGGMRGGSGAGRAGKPKKPVKPKKPSTSKADAMRKHPAGKGLPNQGAKAKVYDIKTGAEAKNPKPVKPASKPMGVTTRGKVVGTVVGGAAVVGTTKGMKRAGEANAARIRRNKAKSVPVPRNPRKQ